jgi:hypothetical protein
MANGVNDVKLLLDTFQSLFNMTFPFEYITKNFMIENDGMLFYLI